MFAGPFDGTQPTFADLAVELASAHVGQSHDFDYRVGNFALREDRSGIAGCCAAGFLSLLGGASGAKDGRAAIFSSRSSACRRCVNSARNCGSVSSIVIRRHQLLRPSPRASKSSLANIRPRCMRYGRRRARSTRVARSTKRRHSDNAKFCSSHNHPPTCSRRNTWPDA